MLQNRPLFSPKSLQGKEIIQSLALWEKVKKTQENDLKTLENFRLVAMLLGKAIEGKAVNFDFADVLAKKPLLNWIGWDNWVQSDVMLHFGAQHLFHFTIDNAGDTNIGAPFNVWLFIFSPG